MTSRRSLLMLLPMMLMSACAARSPHTLRSTLVGTVVNRTQGVKFGEVVERPVADTYTFTERNLPVTLARIELVGGTTVIAKTFTNKQGQFEFKGLAPGAYIIQPLRAEAKVINIVESHTYYMGFFTILGR